MRGFLLNRLYQSLILCDSFNHRIHHPESDTGRSVAQDGLDPGMTQEDLDRLKEQLG